MLRFLFQNYILKNTFVYDMVIPVFAHTTYNIFNYLFLVQCYSRGSTKKGPSAFLGILGEEGLLLLNKSVS